MAHGLSCTWDLPESAEVVAKAYADILPEYTKQFKAIEFAVYCPDGKPTDNYDAFKAEFVRK